MDAHATGSAILRLFLRVLNAQQPLRTRPAVAKQNQVLEDGCIQGLAGNVFALLGPGNFAQPI